MDLTLLSRHLDRLVFISSLPISALNHAFSSLFHLELENFDLQCGVRCYNFHAGLGF